MSAPGAGDRWLAGELPEGVTFAHHDTVDITVGRYAGESGVVVLLLSLDPEPRYLVALGAGRGDVPVWQSALRAAK
jgi:hypothetical protein